MPSYGAELSSSASCPASVEDTCRSASVALELVGTPEPRASRLRLTRAAGGWKGVLSQGRPMGRLEGVQGGQGLGRGQRGAFTYSEAEEED